MDSKKLKELIDVARAGGVASLRIIDSEGDVAFALAPQGPQMPPGGEQLPLPIPVTLSVEAALDEELFGRKL